jgi:hypothetical protein
MPSYNSKTLFSWLLLTNLLFKKNHNLLINNGRERFWTNRAKIKHEIGYGYFRGF